MDTDTISALFGAALSLVVSFSPKLKTWYAKQKPTTKRLLILVSVAAAVMALFLLQCSGRAAVPGWESVTCDTGGALSLVRPLVFGLAGTQGAFLLTTRSRS